MTLTTLDIILIIIAVTIAAAMIVVLLRRKKFVIKTARRFDDKYSSLLQESESEVRRLKLINDQLNKRTAATKSTAATTSAMVPGIDIDKFAKEQKQFEIKQQELSERNKQLWSMSVSIEKERQHIQTLKNEIEAQHRAVTSSIQYAKLIQNAVLPSAEILKESFEDVFLFWRPRDIVSGDYYWMKRIGDTVIFTVADCTGHGVPGAFMSMLGVAFLNEICVEFNDDTHPAQILEQMRNKVITTLRQTNDPLEQKDGMDMGLCILNLATMKMQFAGANNGMYHVRGTTLTEYKAVKNPIAIYPKILPFVDHDVDIQHGDYVYMYSDGYADQFGDDNRKFTSRRLRELLVSINSQTKVASEQAKLLENNLAEWRGTKEQMDDILIGGYCIR
ncbi:MAG: SpoIIE family protein phosphatase [Bacteroidales bacterium]|nr:SpoIIE family protein phosphatase [Bacteroidales bacterium]